MQLRKKLFLLLLIQLPLTVAANFDFNANCLKAYQNIFELKLGTARVLIANEKKLHPNNAIVPLLENYVDYFYLLATDSKTEFDRLEGNKNKRIDQISEDEDNSPYKRYALAEINLQWATIRSRYGSYFTASRELNKANNLLEENAQKFPAFHLNAKGLGLIQVVMGSLPDGFLKNTLAAFGIKGNVQTGLAMLDKLAENLPKSAYEPFFEDVVYNYMNVLNDIVHSPTAYAKTMKYTARFAEDSLLKTYLQAYAAAKNGHNDEAITILNNKPSGSNYQPFPYLDYLMGITRLNKLDYSAATYFDRFLQNTKGVSYIKDTYLHLAWIALLKGDETGYNAYINRTKTIGYTFQERDKQAVNEANASSPNKTLLTARLFFDGGYLSQANHSLAAVNIDSFSALKDKAEYQYRLGRINDDLGKKDTALTHYQHTITYGKSLKQYYAAKAAVLMGEIYEKRKNYAKAKSAYTLAINLRDHDYETGIENEAKQGLKRIP
ncbi:tetratricopeptide repeat protein [Pedobacter sp. Du54]|uniref:tetratricopeptide repeat protein n=1 Tax=Pedobacter anseongensis TaxID=3133439 RepID=UPI00309EAF97